MSALGSLVVKLALEYAQFTQGLNKTEQVALQQADKVQKAYDKMAGAVEDRYKSLKSSIANTIAGAVSVAGLMSVAAKVRDETINAEKEQAQLAAALKSTGEAAGYSQDQLNSMAGAMSKATTYSAGEINQAQARLLSYTNIVGDQFPRALQSAMDMGTRLGMDLNQSMETVAKALDKPSTGMQSLQRQGFKFTESQIEMAKALENSGRLADAQAIVFAELESSYGGAAEAARNTLGGALTAVGNTINDLLTADSASVPALRDSVEELNRLLSSDESKAAFSFYVQLMVSTATAAGKLAVALAELRTGGLGSLLGHATADNAGSELVSIEGKLNKLRADAVALDPSKGFANKLNDVIFGDYGDLQRQIGVLESQREVLVRTVDAADGLGQSYDGLAAGNDAITASMAGATDQISKQGAAVGLADSYLKKYGTSAQKAAIEIAEWKAKLGSAFTPEMEARIKAAYAKQDEGAKASAQSAKQLAGAYGNLVNSIDEKIAQQKSELDGGEKLSDVDKMRIKYQLDLQGALKGLTAAQRQVIDGKFAEAKANEEALKLNAKLNKEREEESKYRQEQQALAARSIEELEVGNQALRDEIELIGLNAAQSAAVLYQRENAILLVKEQRLAELELAEDQKQTMSQTRILLMQEIAARRERLALTSVKASSEASAAATAASVAEWQRGIDQIGQSLADQLMAGGQSFGDYLKNLARTLVFRPIIQAIVQPVGGAVASLMGVDAGSGGVGGMLSGANSLSSIYSAFSGGLVSTVGGAIGTLGSMFGSSALTSFAAGMKGATLATGLAGPTTAGASGAMGLGATFSAALPWLAGGLALVGAWDSLFGRTLKDSGVEGTFGGDAGFVGNQYEYYKGGLFRSNKTVRKPLDDVTNNAFVDQYKGLRQSVTDMGAVMGLTADAVDAAVYETKLSLKGLSEDEAAKKIQEEFARIGENLAQLMLVTDQYNRSGETYAAALQRLSTGLVTFNAALDTLGLTLYEQSLAAADLASQMVDAMGGTQAFAQSINGFQQNYYSEAERMDTLTRQLRGTLTGLDLSIDPALGNDAKAQFRAVVTGALESGNVALASSLLALQDSFAAAADYAQQSADTIAQAAIEQARATAQAAEEAQQAAADLARGLRDSLTELEARFMGGGFAQRYGAEDLAGQVRDMFAGLGIDKSAQVLAQQISTARAADVEEFFRGMYAALPTDEARQQLVTLSGALLDFTSAADQAAEAASNAAEEALRAAQQQRQGLEQTYLQLIGNSAELRRRELDALDPSNRALQQLIWSVQDGQAAFADMERAVTDAGSAARQAWSNWSTASNLGLKYLGDTSGLEAQRAILQAQISSSSSASERLAKLQELIGIEEALGSAQSASRKAELESINIRQTALKKELSMAQSLLSAAQSLGEYAKSLQTSAASGLSDTDRLAALSGQYSTLLGQARGGDADAMSRLQSVTGEYLGLAQAMATSGADYAVLSGRIASELGTLATKGESTAQWQINSYQAQIDQLSQLGTQVEISETTKALIAKSMIDQSEIWDRENTQYLSMIELQGSMTNKLGTLPVDIYKALKPAMDSSASYIASSVGGAVSGAINSLAGMLGLTPQFAGGGTHAGGLRIVGENGPELEATGPSRIWNQPQLAAALGAGGGSTARLEALVEQQTQYIGRLEARLAVIESNTGGIYEITDNVSAGGNSNATEIMNVETLAKAIAEAIKETA